MESLLQDLRYAARGLLRQRGFSAIAVLTLALGTGANAAVFSAVHGALLAGLPFPDADRIVSVFGTSPKRGIDQDVTSVPNFLDWRARTRSFSAMAAADTIQRNLTGDPYYTDGLRVVLFLSTTPVPPSAVHFDDWRTEE